MRIAKEALTFDDVLLQPGYSEVLLDYYFEAEDTQGNVKCSPIQRGWVGEDAAGGYLSAVQAVHQ